MCLPAMTAGYFNFSTQMGYQLETNNEKQLPNEIHYRRVDRHSVHIWIPFESPEEICEVFRYCEGSNDLSENLLSKKTTKSIQRSALTVMQKNMIEAAIKITGSSSQPIP